MSATTIRNKIEEIALEVLGSEYEALPFMFDVDANDARTLDGGVAVAWGEMSEKRRVDQFLCIEQRFTLIITKRVFARTDDTRAVTSIDTVYTSIESILKRFVNEKLDALSNVNEVRLTGVSPPKPLTQAQRDIVSIEISLAVNYLVT